MAWLCGAKVQRLSSCTERRPIGLRSPPGQIAFATRSDFERHPIGFRTLSANSCSSFTFRNITFYTT